MLQIIALSLGFDNTVVEMYAEVIDTTVALALTVVAITPTTKDDDVVGRIANVWRTLRGRR